jgi:hypothetical protein
MDICRSKKNADPCELWSMGRGMVGQMNFGTTSLAPPTPYGTSHVAARSQCARRNVTSHFCSQRQVLSTHWDFLSTGRALSIEVSACVSFGTTGTRPWPRWKRLPPSSFLSWWVLALSCWRKVGGDKRVRQKIDLARRRQTGCLDQRRRSVFGKSTASVARV